ncbi:GMC oxidoreductase [Amylostereum chailletii]|nr:GMC oxidoreductase [Amylostereum chailletii]
MAPAPAPTLATVDQVSGKSYDYIIVGGGTAGLVLATRLTEDTSKTVLVLEAGNPHFDDPNITLPASYAKVFGNPEYDWAFTTVPQEKADGNVFPWNRGKGLGGSSAINFHVFNRPPQIDIDAWESLGNKGWNWKNHLKYSKKTQNFHPPSAEVAKAERLTHDPTVHGAGGPLELGFCTTRTGWDVIVQDTLEKLGWPRVQDPQAGKPVGTGMTISTVDPKTNVRQYSVDYLRPALSRPNLTVLTSASVTLITSFPASNTAEFVASGVEFFVNGTKYTAASKAEVILCAGAIKSPQLLEISGIGNATLLSSIGVEPKVDLPSVGENVQEHTFIGMSWELKEPEKFKTVDPLREDGVAERELQLYEQGSGLFTVGLAGIHMNSLESISPRAAEIHASIPTKSATPGVTEQYAEQKKFIDAGGANVEIICFPGFLSFPKPPEPGKKYISLCPALNHPFSRGSIHATSKDALIQPAIDPRYFEQDVDLQTFVEAVKFHRKLVKTEPLKDIVAKEVNPGPSIQSDAEIATWIKKCISTTYHTAGSCSMLPKDKGGVVDAQLKVYGTRNVRVVDLGIVPLLLASHAQTVAYAIAEQAADIVKGVFKA